MNNINNFNNHYPYNMDYEYFTRLKKVNLDEKRKQSLMSGRGFIVNKVQSSNKKDMKEPNGIYSTRFGQTLDDLNPFMDRYKCECGNLRQRINNNTLCPLCNTKVKYVDDDFGYFGWIVLKDPYYIIHPNIFKQIQFLIGAEVLEAILLPEDEKDIDGHVIKKGKSKGTVNKKIDGPFTGIGMMEFKDRFEEIILYYLSKNSHKQIYYDDIMKEKDKIFIQSIPVYTTHLRPYRLDGSRFTFEKTNSLYYMMTKLSIEINNDKLKMFRKKKTKNQLIYDLQEKYCKLYEELEKILAGKKGASRAVFGGRYNFTSRCVIVPNPSLRVDEVVMPYKAMVELLQQRIINILRKSYNMSYSEAHNIWSASQIHKDERVYNIIKGIIADSGRGVPVIINRNPTISYGGILQMYVVDICDSYTLGLPLQILPFLAADFDGDVLNVMYIINKSFLKAAQLVFNPANAMYISTNDGKLSKDIIHNKDTLINANSLLYLARNNYSPQQLEMLARAKSFYNK